MIVYHASSVLNSFWLVALSVLLSAAGVEQSSAQARSGARLPEGSISGTILDAATSQPLAGATVVVDLTSAGALPNPGTGSGSFVQMNRGVLSDSQGRYRFKGLPPGRYRLQISRPGYRPSSVGVELHGAADSRVSVGLRAPITTAARS